MAARGAAGAPARARARAGLPAAPARPRRGAERGAADGRADEEEVLLLSSDEEGAAADGRDGEDAARGDGAGESGDEEGDGDEAYEHSEVSLCTCVLCTPAWQRVLGHRGREF